MPKYIAIEIGKSAYTEFKMKDGEFHLTEDGVYLGDAEAENEDEAHKKITSFEWNKDRIFDNVIIFEVRNNNHKA